MGLSVGVVSIDYRYDPPQPIPDFFRDLISGPNIGDYPDYDDFDDDSDEGEGEGVGYWCGTVDDAGVLDVNRYVLTERAETWCNDRNLDAAARNELLTWIANLPWKDGSVRLHLVG
jgi:hypothetical protein